MNAAKRTRLSFTRIKRSSSFLKPASIKMSKFYATICLSLLCLFWIRGLHTTDFTHKIEFLAFRNWSDAAAYCKQEGGGLAKMAGVTVYNKLLADITTNGTYWIDGQDKETADRFVGAKDCTQTDLNLADIPDTNLKLTAGSCLALTKHIDPALTKIKAQPCEYLYKGVICGIPTDGCVAKL